MLGYSGLPSWKALLWGTVVGCTVTAASDQQTWGVCTLCRLLQWQGAGRDRASETSREAHQDPQQGLAEQHALTRLVVCMSPGSMQSPSPGPAPQH